jgi:hypothetical protein
MEASASWRFMAWRRQEIGVSTRRRSVQHTMMPVPTTIVTPAQKGLLSAADRMTLRSLHWRAPGPAVYRTDLPTSGVPRVRYAFGASLAS